MRTASSQALEVVSQRDGWSGMLCGHDDTSHGRTTGPRRALGRHLAAAATQATPSQGRPALDPGPSGAGRHHLCPAGRVPRLLPARELGCGSGVTCWRRLRDWQAAGVWAALHHRLLDWLGDDGQVDWSRAAIDSVRVRARRGELVGATPVDRAKPGSKYQLLIDATGLPLAVGLSAATTHDSQLLEPMVNAVPAVIGPRAGPGGRGGDRPSAMAIRAPTIRPAGGCCGAVASRRGLPAAGRVQHQAGPPPLEGGTLPGLAAGQPSPHGPL